MQACALSAAHLGAGFYVGADGLNAEPVAEDGIEGGQRDALAVEFEAWSMGAQGIAKVDEGLDLVHRHEVADAVGEVLRHEAGVPGIDLRGLAALPPAAIFEGLRQIPVEEGAVGLDAGSEQGVDQTLVEVDPLLVGRAGAGRKDAGPRRPKSGSP